jgi:hypothetical protein
LYEIAYMIDDDVPRAAQYIERVADLSTKAGNVHVRLWALLGAYYLAVERGDEPALLRVEHALDAADVAQNTREVADALVPAHALRAAWQGHFANAFRLIEPLLLQDGPEDRRILRWAEAALYAAAAGFQPDARCAAARALRALRRHRGPETRDLVQGAALTAAALVLLRCVDTAERSLERFTRDTGTPSRSLHALVGAADALIGFALGVADHREMREALEKLREQHLGGLAMLLEALPSPRCGLTGRPQKAARPSGEPSPAGPL